MPLRILERGNRSCSGPPASPSLEETDSGSTDPPTLALTERTSLTYHQLRPGPAPALLDDPEQLLVVHPPSRGRGRDSASALILDAPLAVLQEDPDQSGVEVGGCHPEHLLRPGVHIDRMPQTPPRAEPEAATIRSATLERAGSDAMALR